jgi:DNA repair protein RecO (recombination protein O)
MATLHGPVLLLKAVDTGESDKVVTLFGAETGVFSAIARHARGSKRRFGAALQPFCLFEAAWKPKGSGLAFLESAHILEQPLGAEPGLEPMASAYLFLELALELCPEHEAQPVFFELILSGLRRLGVKKESPAAIRVSVLWQALALSGVAPALDRLAPGKLRPQAREALLLASQGLPLQGPLSEAETALYDWLSAHLGRTLRTQGLVSTFIGELS